MLAEPTPLAPGDGLRTARDLVRAGALTAARAALAGLDPVAVDDPCAGRAEVDRLALLLECHLARGEVALATGVGARLAELAARDPLTLGLGTAGATTAHALGGLADARGDHEGAAAQYAAAGRALEPADDDAELVPWRTGAALALVRLGEGRVARDLAAEQLAVARARGTAYAVARAFRTLAAINDDGGRLALLREARAALADLVAERLAAQIDADLAVVLVLHGGPGATAEALGLLRSAEEYACREELLPLQARVRAVLQRLGEPPHLDRDETLATLTPREQKAARLAAEGLTNREIASRLRVSVKAVEWHLSHVYRKLGVPNRAMLADTLGPPA